MYHTHTQHSSSIIRFHFVGFIPLSASVTLRCKVGGALQLAKGRCAKFVAALKARSRNRVICCKALARLFFFLQTKMDSAACGVEQEGGNK